jgi:hypothetical protein
MALYRWLQDGFVAGYYYQAGDIASTANVGGTLPNTFIPPGAVDPLDSAAVTAFFAAGPAATPLMRAQWATQFVAPPVTRWTPGPGANQVQLTGLGAGLVTSGGLPSLP